MTRVWWFTTTVSVKLSSKLINWRWDMIKGRGAYNAKRLLKPNTRWLYLQTWVRKMRWQPLGVTKREIISALVFLVGKYVYR